MRFFLSFAALALLTAAARPAFDPRTLKANVAGPPSEVLVLGSPHLSGLKNFRAEQLGPLLDRLAAFHPDIITVEGLSGQDCEALLRYRTLYGDAWDQYCWGTDDAEKATGLTVPQATAAIKQALAAWPVTPSPSQRRHLAALFLAANDRASAQVQWLRLPAAERRAGDGLDAALVTILRRQPGKYNETYDIAATLAARLGLERVYLTDDHSADAIGADDPPAYGEAIEHAWRSQGTPPVRAEHERREAALSDGTALLGLYRFLNAPRTQRETVASDMGAAAREGSPEHWGRHYVAWWETRNLRMVANIRASFGARPGARVLVVVGATHKPYFDAWLDMMHDVRLADTAAVLR